MTNPFTQVFTDKAAAAAPATPQQEREAFIQAFLTHASGYWNMLDSAGKAAQNIGYAAHLHDERSHPFKPWMQLTLTSNAPMALPHLFVLSADAGPRHVVLSHANPRHPRQEIGTYSIEALTTDALQDALTTWIRDDVC